jgi:hypothetical protein
MADFKRSNLPTRPGLSKEEVEDLHEAFQLFDADGGGTIDKEVRNGWFDGTDVLIYMSVCSCMSCVHV